MSRIKQGRYENFVNQETGEIITIRKYAVKNGDLKGGFSKVFDHAWDKLSVDLANTSFRAAFRTYVEMVKRLNIGSNEVTIYPSELMRILDLGEMAVRTHLKILERKGYIKRKFKEKGRHVYIVNNMYIQKG